METIVNHERSMNEVFGPEATRYLQIVDMVVKKAKAYGYTFYTDESFSRLIDETPLRIGEINRVLAHELLEKCHLCAVSATFRNRSWMNATAREYENKNYFGFAASARGYIESVADSMDGLLEIGCSLAEHNAQISSYLSGKVSGGLVSFETFEEKLDHYMFAGWTRDKDKIRKAKDAQVYVESIQSSHIPDLITHWRKLCAIAHPSSSSVNIFYDFDDEMQNVRFNEHAEHIMCDRLLQEVRPSLNGILPYSMNPSLLVLRVMHKFPGYPKIEEMKKMAFDQIPIWKKISKFL